jgi:transcriptional regulator NrdR family protein
MTIELSKEEKIQVINSHQKSLAYSKYNLEIDIMQENAKSTINTSLVENLQLQIEEVVRQLSALDAELATVVAE